MTIQPLNDRVPIINSDGTPTQYFIRMLQERGITVGEKIDAEQAVALIEEWSAGRDINVTSPITGGGNLDSDITIGMAPSGVTPGAYTSANITVDTFGRVTLAANGSGGGGSGAKRALVVPYLPKSGSTGVSGNFFVSRFDIVQADATIDAVCVPFAAAAGGATVRPGIYASDSFGTIGTLLASGPPIVGVTTGVNVMPLTTPLAVTAGDYVYIGYQGEAVTTSPAASANLGAAFFSNTGTLPSSPSPSYSPQNWLSMFARLV